MRILVGYASVLGPTQTLAERLAVTLHERGDTAVVAEHGPVREAPVGD